MNYMHFQEKFGDFLLKIFILKIKQKNHFQVVF
jgi:hypothetical protein